MMIEGLRAAASDSVRRIRGSSMGAARWQWALAGCLLACAARAHEPVFHPIVRPPTRPDFLPHPLYDHWVPYRAEHNRPRPVVGKMIFHIEPTSQEAYTWHRAKHNREYARHAGWVVPRYYYPKPWEVLPTGPRYDRSAADKNDPVADPLP
jgi:hypothetical protein